LKTQRWTLLIVGLAVLLLAGLACLNKDPYRAGEGGSASLKLLPHNMMLGGTGHADGMCDAINFCSACHGANLQGGTNGEPSCTKCHGVVWGSSDCGKLLHTVNLGGHMHAPNYCQPFANCTGCHGADLRGGTKGQPSCFTCHGDLWTSATCGQNPHTVDLGGVFHAPNYCRPYQNCTSCHGSVLHGGTNGAPSCLQCHDQEAWFNCSGHNTSFDGNRHASGYCTPYANCVFCHGDNLQGGPNNEPRCTECHGDLWTSCGGAQRIKR
jgi:hypothetical protein